MPSPGRSNGSPSRFSVVAQLRLVDPAFLAALRANLEPLRAPLQKRDLLAALADVEDRIAAARAGVHLDVRIVDDDFPILLCSGSSHKPVAQNASWHSSTSSVRRIVQLTGHPVIAKGLLQYCAPMSSHSATSLSSAVLIQPACVPPASKREKNPVDARAPAELAGDPIETGAVIGLPIASVPITTCSSTTAPFMSDLAVVREQELAVRVELRRLVRRQAVREVELSGRHHRLRHRVHRRMAAALRAGVVRDHGHRHRIDHLARRAPQRMDDRLIADHDPAIRATTLRCSSCRPERAS